MFFWIYKTTRTGALLAAGNEALFWVICDVSGYNQVDGTYKTISANHVNAIFASVNQGFQQCAHALMKELVPFTRACLLGETLELAHRDIPNQDHCPGGRLPTCFLRNVANTEVDRPGLLITTEARKIRFVG